ncbi:MAG: hypothetical protein ABUL71_01990, partial [Gemmatimonadota bacterium]
MRILRRLLAVLILPILVVLTTVIGGTGVIVMTQPGHALLARIATSWITAAAAGTVEIGEIKGNLWDAIELNHVAIHDSAGNLVLQAAHVEARYILPDLFRRRQLFRNVQVDSLVLHLVRLRPTTQFPQGHWNWEKVFHLGEGPDNGLPPPQMAFYSLRLTNAFVQVDAPTTPGERHKPISRHGAAPAQDSVVRSADGPVRIYTIRNLNAYFDSLRLSTPRHDPIFIRVESLRGNLSDPAIDITRMKGTILTAADTLRFKFDSVSLPSSLFIGDGRVRWPHDSLQFDLALVSPQVALRDLWWIQPDLPDWTGKGRITSHAFNGSRTDYKLENLVLGDARSSTTGNIRLQVERVHGLGMRDGDLQLQNVPIDVLRPYLDTLPVSGDLTGHLLVDGFLDAMHLGGDVVFADRLVRGTPTSHLRIDGVVHFGGAEGAVFERFRLNQSA